MRNDLVVIPCPDLKSFPEQPKDQSKCESFPCPECNENMWLSEKKREILIISNTLKKEVILGCYPCILKKLEEMKNNGDLVDETMWKQIRI